jgi:tetratricopeptide (TPR) repeat protein
MSRRIGDEPALLSALYSRSISLEGFEAAKERLAAATEIVTLAERLGNKEMALRGHFRRIRDLYTVGDISALDQETETYGRLAEELRQPLYLWLAPFYRSTVALLDGRFDESEQLARQSLDIGQRAQDQNAIVFFNVQIVTLRGLQGRSAEVEPNVKTMVEKSPAGAKAWQATLAKLYYDMDRRAEARAEFETLAVNNFTDLPIDGAYVTALALLAQVSWYLGDDRRAAMLYDLLAPFGGQNIAIGSAAVFYGPASRYLGLLAATMSRWDEAARHFEDALKMTAQMRARPSEAYVQVEYAAMLLASRRPADREKAAQLLNRGLCLARELGMRKLVDDATALLSTANPASGHQILDAPILETAQ